ncbi:MAG: hypothetical protein Q7S30_01635 [Candidatus Omnitrophota bacterium]|nr:hypothetical protein [Candidatus Omnitrophota bacterium]
MKEFKLSISTPEKTIFDGKVVSLVAPAENGYLGILADHAGLIASLKYGNIIIRKNSGEAVKITLSGKGFLEVDKNEATILLTTGKYKE